MTLLDLLQQDKIEAKKVAGTKGKEYAGPCSSCGGEDRFRVWPEESDGGRYWCRGCDRKGDAIQYLRDFRKLGYLEACSLLGQEPKEGKRSLNWDRRAGNGQWKPQASSTPDELWQGKAKGFVGRAEFQMSSAKGAKVREWLLSQRGLSEETTKAFRLGWNPKDEYHDRQTWGLSDETGEDGKAKKLWIPAGLVIPKIRAGVVVAVKVRVSQAPAWNPKLRYCLLRGSTTEPLVALGGPSCIVVESELDAILLHQEAGDLCTAIALGSASNRPDQAAAALLDQAETILVSLDSDEAGAKAAWQWWVQHYPKAKRWPVIRGKDPTEAKQNGLDLRAWVLAGLPIQEPAEPPAAQPQPALSNPYPNQDGLVKCCYCHYYRDHRCTHGHQPDGISLLRECGDFGFKGKECRCNFID